MTYQSFPPALCGSIFVDLQPILGQLSKDFSPYRPTSNVIVILIPGISPSDLAEITCALSELLRSRYSPALTLSLPGPRRNWSKIMASIFYWRCKLRLFHQKGISYTPTVLGRYGNNPSQCIFKSNGFLKPRMAGVWIGRTLNLRDHRHNLKI